MRCGGVRYVEVMCVLSAGRHLSSTEWQPSDTHLLVAAHLLLEVGEEEGGQGLLWEAALELEEGRRSSPSNHQITLLLFRVYAELGEGWGTPRVGLCCLRVPTELTHLATQHHCFPSPTTPPPLPSLCMCRCI